MLQSLKQLYGHHLAASDGEVGHVKDFYFDDQSWAVRYVIADTGSWLPGRLVLISPYAFGGFHQEEKRLFVNLKRKQIENSPSIETHKPVSRQYEEEYYAHYGWPGYWTGDGLWGVSGLPVTILPAKPSKEDAAPPTGPQPKPADVHLRSAQAVTGYHVQATDGIIGHVCDFMMDEKSWAIPELVVKTGHRLSGKEVQIPSSLVARISYEESTVFLKVTQAAVEQKNADSAFLIAATD